MKVTQSDLWLCSDCTFVACNGEHGGEFVIPVERIRDGLARLGANLVPDFDSNTGDGLREFSNVPCASCETLLAGYRARFAILSE